MSDKVAKIRMRDTGVTVIETSQRIREVLPDGENFVHDKPKNSEAPKS